MAELVISLTGACLNMRRRLPGYALRLSGYVPRAVNDPQSKMEGEAGTHSAVYTA
jgi:hypothetical protein